MVKEKIEFIDFDGNKREETHYFHLSQAELAMLQMKINGGFVSYIQTLVEAQDMATLSKTFKDIIDMSYGIKATDGSTFTKSPEITAKFTSSNAYNVLFMRLFTDSEYCAKFINGVIEEPKLKTNPVPAPNGIHSVN